MGNYAILPVTQPPFHNLTETPPPYMETGVLGNMLELLLNLGIAEVSTHSTAGPS